VQKVSALKVVDAAGRTHDAVAVASANSRESPGFGNNNQVARPKHRAKVKPSTRGSLVGMMRVRRMEVQMG
jgi:hypothetical protein